jgi:hypothetical protein
MKSNILSITSIFFKKKVIYYKIQIKVKIFLSFVKIEKKFLKKIKKKNIKIKHIEKNIFIFKKL